MGQPKALLPFDGEPLVIHIVSALGRLFDEVIVVAAPGQELPSMTATVVRDEVPHQGPVGGICYGLRAARGDVCFVASCDSAFLNPRLISHLVSEAPGFDVVVPRWEGRLQPVHAAYRRGVLPLLEAQLARGELRPAALFDTVRTRTLDEGEIRRFDPEGASFFNMNTPEDYLEAQRRWSAPIRCRVELFGVARLLGGTREVQLHLPPRGEVAHALAALADALPALVGRVIGPDRRSLVEGYACSINGVEFVRTAAAPIGAGDTLMILSADAGG